MAFKDFPETQQGVLLLQRSLERGRLGHAYLFTGHQLEQLEALARTLAKTLNCQNPVKRGGVAVDCCDKCLACQKIEHGNHADVHWVRPESKTRITRIEQIRDLIQEINLKPTEAEYKVAIVVAADRLRTEAANAFLKTLEEPPPKSVLILLTTEPQRILETILSRCLRLNFGGDGPQALGRELREWLQRFSELAAVEQKSLLGRYRLMDVLVAKLNEIKNRIQETLTARSPLEQYKDAEKELIERWEDELAAAIEAEYRRQRADLLGVLQWWLRDVWVRTLGQDSSKGQGLSLVGSNQSSVISGRSGPSAAPGGEPDALHGLLTFADLGGTGRVAARISAGEARENLQIMEQLQRWLSTNVQEALALEVGLLKLRL
jgi:DNA polymerase-3 subunit delta'